MPSLRSLVMLAVAPALATRPAVATAQGGAVRSVRLGVENDLFALRGAGAPPDHDYTHGSRVAVAWAGAPEPAGRAMGRRPSRTRACRSAAARRRGCVASSIELGQAIYTPRLDAPAPVPGERPYAGWLSLSAAAQAVAPGRIRSASVEVGVTGPPSLAAQMQGGVHRLLHNAPQLGWAHQLAAQPGVVVRYEEARHAERLVGAAGAVAVVRTRWGATVGTTITALSAGADARLGLLGAPDRRALTWSPAEPDAELPRRLYALAGVRQDFVLRDVFIQGYTPGSGAVLRPFVGQAEVGLGYRRRSLAVEYRHVVRGREYRAQPRAHAYGSLSVVWHSF